MRDKYVVIKTDGSVIVGKSDTGNEVVNYKFMNEAVGGFIERVYCTKLEHKGIDLWVNEEGFLIELPVNECGTKFANDNIDNKYVSYHPFAGRDVEGVLLAGDVLVLKHDGEGNTLYLTDDEVESLFTEHGLNKASVVK